MVAGWSFLTCGVIKIALVNHLRRHIIQRQQGDPHCANCQPIVQHRGIGRLAKNLPLPLVGIHRCDGRNRHNILDVIAGLQNMHRRAHPQQNRPNRLGMGQPRKQLV